MTPIQLWGNDYEEQILTSKVNGKSNLTLAIEKMISHGIVLISELSVEPNEVLRVAEKLGFVRCTNYGALFDVIAEPDPINLAYTPLGLPLHTDNPYRDPCPGVQLLHCIKNASEGGESQFADGFRAATLLKRQYPRYFSVLSKLAVSFRFSDHSVDLCNKKPIIELGPEGDIIAIRINHRSMQAPRSDIAMVEQFYPAYQKFAELLAAEESVINIKLNPGELVMFDNSLVLHGRSAYRITEGRHLQGCYIDIDAIRSSQRLAGVQG